MFVHSGDSSDTPFDFWIGGVRGEPAPSFSVSWTAEYIDDAGQFVTCDGSTGVIPVATGLDRAIRINRSIAAIGLRFSVERVRDALGPPPRVRRLRWGPRIFAYPGLGVRVWLMRSHGAWKVHSVRVTSRLFRTPKGIGVGSSVRALRARYPGARCFGGRGYGQCQFRQLSPAPTTLFTFRHGRITEVVLTHMGD